MGAGDRLAGGRQLRPLSRRSRSTSARRRPPGPQRRAHPVAQAGPRHRLRDAGGATHRARARRRADVPVHAQRPARHHADDARARRTDRRERMLPTPGSGPHRETARGGERAGRGTPAAEDAARVRARAGIAAAHQRERRLRLPPRPPRAGGRHPTCSAISSGNRCSEHGDDSRPGARGDHRAALRRPRSGWTSSTRNGSSGTRSRRSRRSGTTASTCSGETSSSCQGRASSSPRSGSRGSCIHEQSGRSGHLVDLVIDHCGRSGRLDHLDCQRDLSPDDRLMSSS